MVHLAQRSGVVHSPRDRTTLFYTVHGAQGSGTPILAIPGATQITTDWGDLPDKLAQASGQLVIVYDARGLGDSTLPSPEAVASLSLEAYAHDVVDLLKGLSVSEVDLLTWSLGVCVANWLLSDAHTTFQPDKGFVVAPGLSVRRTLLTGTFVKHSNAEASAEWTRFLSLFVQAQGLDPVQMWKEMSERIIRTFYPSGYPEQSEANRATFQARVNAFWSTPEKRPLAVLGQQAQFIAPGVIDLGPRLRALSPEAQARIGILSCSHDLIISPAERQGVHDALPFAQTIQPPASAKGQVGHLWWEAGNPDDWASVVVRFFESK